MLFIIYLLIIIKLSEGQIAEDGNCSVVESNKKIDISKFTGEWYEVANIPNEYEQFVKCTTFNLTLNSNKTIDIVVTSLGSIGGNVFQWQGLGTRSDENSMSYFIEFPELAIKGKTILTIIDTDYVNYGILFMCQNVGELR
ncbi:uncharacterized protein LOC122855328 [Aphidius gifuensis]|nr:uncharacterized protein LOC122855328 [Aphidius gifuensis]